MANIMDYLDWRGDLSFVQSPFNEVDNLILCKLCCADFTGIVPESEAPVSIAQAVKGYFTAHREKGRLGVFFPKEVLAMMRKLPKTVRFGGLQLSNYVNRVDPVREEQFSALTMGLSDNTYFVAFRGTDDTIVAWKENFNMSVVKEVPAQNDAMAYLQRQLHNSDKDIRVGGHSKGGNLAVYAAMRSPTNVQDRILNIYNNDGPGFYESVIDTPEYRCIRPKVLTVVPRHSLVGMLLSHEDEYEIINSTETGIYAHDGFTWEVKGTRFVRSKGIAVRSTLFERTFQNWSKNFDLDRRQQFIDTLFMTLTSTGAQTLTDLNEHKLKQAIKVASNLRQSPEERKLITLALKMLIKAYVSSAQAVLPIPEIKPKGILSRKKELAKSGQKADKEITQKAQNPN